MEIRRLEESDADVAVSTIVETKPIEERDGCTPSVEHMGRLLVNERNYFLSAHQDSEPVGFLLAYALPCADREAYLVYLYDVYVKSSYRGQRVASRMVELLKELCGDMTVYEFWAGTTEENTPARKLLERMGGVEQPYRYLEYAYRP